MIEQVIEASIRNRFLVMLLAAGLAVAGVYAVLDTPVDAIPDLSENQVIVFTDWMGRSPQEIEDQVTYPLSLKLQGLAGVRAVRSTSEFNFSMITLIFEDKVDFYFARERVLERLTLASTFLPEGVVPYLAPDSTALGQIFWYTLEGGRLEPGQRWALQQYYVAPELNSVPGVAEVGTVGGQPREYQIDVDPNSLRAYGITLGELYEAVARGNSAVGGRVVQKNNAEFLIRSLGWIESTRDIENLVIRERQGTPIYVKNVARVQIGTQFRRSVFEKNGDDMVGGVTVMRYGENPLAVTERIKKKIQELQPGLPEGVHIVPAYDRTGLIYGAIHSLTEVMWHEMVIAAFAILLILVHVRSVFVICVTLPLSVLFSFLMMWLLRRLGIVDIQANIMSLAGITISIGILVDQAIVMVENATHHLKERFGDQPVTGDTREIVIRACRTVGRPIFFSVLIILLSFIPVFAMSGREGKLFHPMAFTKSLAMVGVALISVTLVPALIPTFIKGRIRGEEDNWIVRSFISIYRPLLTWAMPRWNLTMWLFSALLILAAGMFPLPALLGLGASHHYWEITYFAVLLLVITLTVYFVHGVQWQALSFVSLMVLGMVAYYFPKIGAEFMPPLEEGTLMDMPITVPRASITEAVDDIKARDAILRGFPEVASVIGKAGRADTPTDPAPLDMIETFVNFRPYELWPRRVLRFHDASRQSRHVLSSLEQRGYVTPAKGDERDGLINDATMLALTQYDDSQRTLAARRYQEFEQSLRVTLTRFVIEESIRRFDAAGLLHPEDPERLSAEVDVLIAEFAPRFGKWLARQPALEDVSRLTQETARHLATLRALRKQDDSTGQWVMVDPADALELHESPLVMSKSQLGRLLGIEPPTFARAVLEAVMARRLELWRAEVNERINWELYDRGLEAYTWAAMEELGRAGRERGLVPGTQEGQRFRGFLAATAAARQGEPFDQSRLAPFVELRGELEKHMKGRSLALFPNVLLTRRQPGTKGDLIQEMDTVLQVPGWKNIWTKPIINRVDMLATGVRTQIGVKVFGPDLATIARVSKLVEEAVKNVKGARDVIAEPVMGKGYLEIDIDRERAARYGVRVGDIQETIEVALGGRTITQTVEGRNRFPVRIRYARSERNDEETVRRLLVSRPVSDMGMNRGSGMTDPPPANVMPPAPPGKGMAAPHTVFPGHSANANLPAQVPLAEVADVRIVEGPKMIRSENGRLVNYVTLNVRDRDVVGFVDEAQRVVTEKVSLPAGVHVQWSGEFEHQVRAARTLGIVFPAVVVLIFLILYLTYNDLADAVLMWAAIPEALAGGVFFQFFFPKILSFLQGNGWDAPPVDFSVAIWVGYIAAFGMATETGIIMLVYLREAIDKRGGLENIKSFDELREAVIEGAVHRLRPKLLTEGTAILAIAPMLFASGPGSEILSAMALPVLGGLLIADEVVDVFLPVRFYWIRRERWLKLQEGKAALPAESADQMSLEGNGLLAPVNANVR
ncbi:MAG: efflux RND transporter permease subunit [Gemmataceae bacterium]